MRGIRITGTILIAIAILFGLAATFMSTAHTILGSTEETYTLWGVTVDGATAVTETSWADNDADGTGGITFLRLAGVPLVLGLMLAITALILTVVPRTSDNLLGGIFAGLGFVGMIIGLILHGSGLILHGLDVFDRTDVMFSPLAGMYLLGLAITLLFVAGLIGMTTPAQEVPRMAAGSGSSERLRRMRCPECSNIEAVAPGFLPTCESCGYRS